MPAYVYTHHNIHLEARGQLIEGAGSLIPFCESQKAKSKFPELTTQVEKI